MLNLKKGLAVVLAAATALTFAPVSTLGLTGVSALAAVNAEAVTFKNGANPSVDTDGYLIGTFNLNAKHQYELFTSSDRGATQTSVTKEWTAINVQTGKAIQSSSEIIDIDGTTNPAGSYKIYIPESETTSWNADKDYTVSVRVVLDYTTPASALIIGTHTFDNAKEITPNQAAHRVNTTDYYKVADLTKGHVYAVSENGTWAIATGVTASGTETVTPVTAAGSQATIKVDADDTVLYTKTRTQTQKVVDLGTYTSDTSTTTVITDGTKANSIGEKVLNTDTQGSATVDKTAAIVGSFTIPQNAYANIDTGTWHGKGSGNAASISGVENVIRLDDGYGFYLQGVKIKVQNGNVARHYKLFNKGGLRFFDSNSVGAASISKTTSFFDPSSLTTAQKNAEYADNADLIDAETAGNDAHITVDILVPSAGDHTFTFADYTNAGENNSISIINVTLKAGESQSSITDNVDIYTLADSTTALDQDNDGNEEGAFNLGRSTWYNNDNTYRLQLNGTKYGYALKGLGNDLSAATWTGVSDPYRDNVSVSLDNFSQTDYLDSTGKLVQEHLWVNPVPNADGSRQVRVNRSSWKDSATYGKDSLVANETSDIIFKPQTVTTSPVTLNVTARYTNGSHSYSIASKALKVTVDKSSKAIDYITYKPAYDGQTYVSDSEYEGLTYDAQGNQLTRLYKHDENKLAHTSGIYYTLGRLDTLVHTSGDLGVKAEGNYSFRSSDDSILTIDQNGHFEVKGVGTATIYVFVGATQNNEAKVAEISATVHDVAVDEVLAEFSGNTDYDTSEANLDVSSQTKGSPVKEDTVTVKSVGGLTPINVSVGDSAIASVVDNGNGTYTVRSGQKAGTTTITFSTVNSTTKKIQGAAKTVRVNVYADPAASFSLNEVSVNTGETKSLADSITGLASGQTVTWNPEKYQNYYTLTNDTVAVNNQTSSRLTAGNTVGATWVYATVTGTGVRPTTKRTRVYVLNKDLTNVITLAEGSKSFNLEEGATAQITATAKSGVVTFKSSDDSVVSVVSGGAITANKAGNAVITASADGAQSVEIPVIVTAKEKVVTPVAVTGLKVKNKKGAYVSVTWDAQDPSILYRVYKKVGNASWKAKNVTDPKATLQVKKGAKVQVKVKAFRRDENGKAVWGPKATKAKTFKTDKK